LLGWFVFLMVSVSMGVVIKRLPRVKNKVFALSKDQQDKLVHSWLLILKLYKLAFILLPLGLIVVPYAAYRFGSYQEGIYVTIMLILAYLAIWEDYLFRKALIKEVTDKNAQELVP
jgi:hypothetical protein